MYDLPSNCRYKMKSRLNRHIDRHLNYYYRAIYVCMTNWNCAATREKRFSFQPNRITWIFFAFKMFSIKCWSHGKQFAYRLIYYTVFSWVLFLLFFFVCHEPHFEYLTSFIIFYHQTSSVIYQILCILCAFHTASRQSACIWTLI